MGETSATVQVIDKGRVTIPAAVRDKLGIEVGDVVEITVEVDE